MADLFRDLRHALRSLRKNPSFTLLAVLMLALGIGANAAIFSVVHRVLLSSLPYEEPERLVKLFQVRENRDNREGDSMSPADFLDLERESRTVEAWGGFGIEGVSLTGAGEAERVLGASVSPGFFDVLAVAPALGPGFSDGVGPAEVMLSWGFWQRRFNGDPSLMGSTLTLDGDGYQVVGVLPEGFRGVGFADADVWKREPEAIPQPPQVGDGEDVREIRGMHYFPVVGRLAPGVSLAEAQEEMLAFSRRFQQEYPDEHAERHFKLRPLHEVLVSDLRPALLTLLGAVGLVLLIACTNVASLMLTRAAARERELAVKTALGASRARVVLGMLLEGALLALAGGAAGLAVGRAGLATLLSLAPESIHGLGEVNLSGAVVGFTFLVSLVCVLAATLVPALTASRPSVTGSLKEGSGKSTEGRGGQRLRGSLVVAQVALAVVLMAGAGLLLRSFLLLNQVSPGFDAGNVLTFGLMLPPTRYAEDAAQTHFFETAAERLAALPGAESAAAVLTVPFGQGEASLTFQIEGEPPPDPGHSPVTGVNVVTPGYFDTLRIPLLAGRDFTPSDHADAPGVVVVNRRMAEQFFEKENPLGRRLTFDDPAQGDAEWFTIVGLIPEIRHAGLDVEPRPEVYLSYGQFPWRFGSFVVRTEGDPQVLAPAARRTILALDPGLPTEEFTPLAQAIDESLADREFLLVLVGLFAGLALVLSVLGLYGVVSYLVARRTREIGVRMALGADRGKVLASVVGRGVALAAVGTGVGLVAAVVSARLLESLLYGVRPADPLAFAAVSLLLLAAASLAAFFPARRAASVEPAVALKSE